MDTNNDVAAQSAVEETTTQTSSPQVEEVTTESQTTVVPSTQGVPDELPESIEEQRKAFQEMRRELKQLKEEKQSHGEVSGSAFDAFKPKQPAIAGVDMNTYTDPLTGQVDFQSYNQAIQQTAQTTAYRAAQEAIDESTAKAKHPELFANKDTEREIADLWFAAKMRGEDVTVTQVADNFAKRFGTAVSKAEKIGAERALTEVSEKEKAAMAVVSQGSSAAKDELTSYENDQAMDRVRRGDTDTLANLMSRVPWAGK